VSIQPNLARVQHDPFLCGLDPQLCPGCAATPPAPPDEDQLEWHLQLALGLPRRPLILDRNKQRDFLLEWLDVLKTVRHRPQFAAQLGDLYRALLQTAEGA
jgi:hypothetical protein